MSFSGQTDLLKLYEWVCASAGKVKTTNLFADNSETVRNVCLNKNDKGFVYVIFDTTNPQNRALHDMLHILSPRQFEVSRLITLHNRRGENKQICI